ncbi:MAG TPA: VWA domain-containing protein [Microlunatus sp.]|nr:VWA domain-containing protein [Microlunatus sp.]
MSLAHPLLLVVGLMVTTGLAAAAVVLSRRRSAAMVAAGLTAASRRPRPPGPWLTVAGLVALALAVAGPSASLPVGRSAGTVVLAVDVSNSMAADDVAPSRLAVAQQAALAFIDAQPDTVDIGVVGFDQGALTSSPVGQDRAASKAAVENLRISGGTSLASAILGSLTAVTGETVTIGQDAELPDLGHWGSATIIVFSDGEDSSGTPGADAVTDAATIAQNSGIHIETVGVGTVDGTTVELDGFRVHSALDVAQLREIAEITGGAYHGSSEVAQLADEVSKIDLRLTVADQDVPLAGALCAVALVLISVGAVLSAARTGRLV